MNKKIMSFFIAVVLILSSVIPVAADFEKIESGNESILIGSAYIWPVNGGQAGCGLNCGCSVHGGRHNGLDINGVALGTPVMATASGTVICSNNYQTGIATCPVCDNNGAGLHVEIQHANGMKSQYCHLSSVNVSNGQTVSQGQVIGAVGRTGFSTGAHLHFVMATGNGGHIYWKGVTSVNPLNYVSPSNTPAAVNISYQNMRIPYVDNWNAEIYADISNPNRAVVSRVGAYVWNSAGALVVDHVENCGLSYQTIHQALNIVAEAKPNGLPSGQTFTCQLWAEANGQRFYSGKQNFTTKGTSASLTYQNMRIPYVDNWNAEIYADISNPDRAVVSRVGAYVWNSAGVLVVDYVENCGLSYQTIHQALNIVAEAKPNGLPSGQTFTCQFWAEANGQIFYSEKQNFTTTGTEKPNPLDETPPVISEVEIRDLSGSGYTVVCKVKDNFKMDKVLFPTWSVKNGTDDIVWKKGKNEGSGIYSVRVNIKDHKEDRGTYRTRIYAYDAAGNRSIHKIDTINVTTTKNRVIANGTYEIVTITDNTMAIDIANASKSNKAKTILYKRNGNANQKFKISYYGSGYYKIIASHSNKALDVYGGFGFSGNTLEQYTWNKSKAQLFKFIPAGNGYYYIQSKAGTYIDLRGGIPANNKTVWMYKGNKGNAQKWKLIHQK